MCAESLKTQALSTPLCHESIGAWSWEWREYRGSYERTVAQQRKRWLRMVDVHICNVEAERSWEHRQIWSVSIWWPRKPPGCSACLCCKGELPLFWYKLPYGLQKLTWLQESYFHEENADRMKLCPCMQCHIKCFSETSDLKDLNHQEKQKFSFLETGSQFEAGLEFIMWPRIVRHHAQFMWWWGSNPRLHAR